MSARATIRCALCLLVVAVVAPGASLPGSLDHSFGIAGLVLTDFSDGHDSARGLAIQPDGRILAVGSEGSGRFALARYLESGRLDATFGKSGRMTAAPGISWAVAYAVVLQPDGRILVAGTSDGDFALARFEANGALDPKFGSGGWVVTDFAGGGDSGHGVALQADGRIIVAGSAWSDSANANFGLARYRPDGSLDTDFGLGGKVSTDISGASDIAYAVALQPDGKIVVAGSAGTYPDFDFAVVRYLAKGELDPEFGTKGKVTTDFRGSRDVAYGVVILSDDRIVAAGVAEPNGQEDFALACYLRDGTLDDRFGSEGRVLTDFGLRDLARALIVLPGDRLVAAGAAGPKPGLDFGLAAYLADGTLDPSFGTDGLVTTDVGGDYDVASALAVQPDGMIVAAGEASYGSISDFALARYGAVSTAPKEVGLLQEQVDTLVKDAVVTEGLGNSLQQKLEAADVQFTLGKPKSAKQQVEAFVLEVKARKGKRNGIPASDADEMVETANVILGK